MTHNLFSQDSEKHIAWFDKYDKKAILKAIVEHLILNPTDVLEHCKEFAKNDVRRFYGNEIVNFYGVNKKGKICRIITDRMGKETYKELKLMIN